jgi:hypothetical protein
MRSLILVLVVAACGTDQQPSGGGGMITPTAIYLTPTQHLTRASMALRGVRPSVADLQTVAADASQLPAIVDRYLASPEFGATMKDLHNELLLMRVEQTNMTFPAVDKLDGKTFTELNAVYDEPLRLIEDVITHDQPYTDIVTANYTLANQTVADLWGLPHLSAPDNWERTQFTDGRPASGILASSIVFARWRSTGFNFNRGRANMISRSLLCHDFLTSDIDVDTSVDLSNPDIVADAVVNNPSCAGCHQTLDPLASYMFTQDGNPNLGHIDTYPLLQYHAKNVDDWKTTNKRPPLFFGQPAPGMDGLGQAIATDPRFAQCAAQHFAAYLTERAQADLPLAWVAALQQGFVASNFSAKALAKQVVLSDEFRVAGDSDPVVADTAIGYQKARPEQLARMISDLTGFQWMTTSTLKARGAPIGTTDLLQSDYIGFRVLEGGIDSYFVSAPVFTMNATSSLAARQVAGAAADFVVEHDATVTPRTLFGHAPTITDQASVRTELVNLHARIYGDLVASDDPAIDETYAMFSDAFVASNDAKRAWKLVLVGMLSDLRALYF